MNQDFNDELILDLSHCELNIIYKVLVNEGKRWERIKSKIDDENLSGLFFEEIQP